jgi:uracil-DNA glycosylase family 4
MMVDFRDVLERDHIFNRECKACPLHESASHVCIPGRGSLNPKVMVVGEAPGSEEDRDGRCFVGPAGQLLQQTIETYNLRPAYLTNAVKCWPPGPNWKKKQRAPSESELGACRGYLDAEIDMMKPRVIVALGNVPLKLLTGITGTKTWSGQVVGRYRGVPVFALLHPSYILRYERDLPLYESHVKELTYLLDPTQRPKKVRVSEIDPGGWRDWVVKCTPPVAFDLETSGKFKQYGGRIRAASMSDGKTSVWMDVDKHGRKALAAIRDFYLNDQFEKSAHGAAFERRWCMDEFGVEPVGFVWDTLSMSFLIDENSSTRLDAVAHREAGAPPWDIDPVMARNDWTWETVPMYVLGPYNAEDSYWTAVVRPILWDKMGDPKFKLREFYERVVLPQSRVAARLEHRGRAYDRKWMGMVDRKYAEVQDGIVAGLDGHPEVVKLRRMREAKKQNFNWKSDHQKRTFFYDIMKMPVIQRTDGGQPSVAAEVLDKLKDKSPLVGEVCRWTGLQTLRTNFLQKWPRFMTDAGIVHGSFNANYVVTGRFSVTNPPEQAIPEDVLTRGMLVSRWGGDGGKIGAYDYRQLEVRLVASESGEERLLRAIRDGADLHDLTARLVFGKDFTKRQRSIAKRINFGIVYGISEYSLAQDFSMSEDEAARIMKRFRDAYPALFRWMIRQHQAVDSVGYLVNRFGRVRRFPQYKSVSGRQREAMHREAGNFPIASLGADITNIAMIKVDAHLRKVKAKSVLCHQVHDSLLVDLHPDEVNVVTPDVVRIMSEVVPGMCPWLKVKLDVDATTTRRWGGARWDGKNFLDGDGKVVTWIAG